MSRSGGSLHVQPGVISLRGAQGAQDSPSSVSLTGLAGLEAAQGSLTSNALFGSLNLEELLGSREMEQQGRELLHSMRAAEAHQRVHRLADGGGPPALPPAHPAGLPPPEFDGFPKPEPTSLPLPGGKTSDDIWRGLGMDLAPGGGSGGGGWPSASGPLTMGDLRQPGARAPSPLSGDAAQPSLAPALGGYLQPGGGSLRTPSGGPPGTPPSPAQQHQQQQQQMQHHQQQQQMQHQQQQLEAALERQLAAAQQFQQQQQLSGGGLGATQPSLASSISGVSSTGLTHGLGALGVFSSSSTEVASHLMSAGGSAWYSQLGLQPPGARTGSGLPPRGLGGPPGGGGSSALQNAQAALQNAAGSLQPGGSSLSSYDAMGGVAHSGGANASPNISGGRDPREGGLRRGSAGAYPGMGGSSRFSSHAPLPAAGALYRGELPQGGPPELPQGGPDGSPPRGYGHEPPLPTAGGKFVSGQGAVLLGAMLPPPNLVIHSGGGAPLHRRVSANGRMQAAPACPPDVEALQQQSPRPPPAKRQQQRSLPQPAGSAGAAAAPAAAAPAAAAPADRGGKGSSAAAAGTFPNIPTTVPRVRSAPADDDFDVKSEVRSECGRGGRGRGKARGLSERDKEQRDLKRKEANRESAARSRDKRLKLIADLEVEVQQLKRQHAEFKARVIESTVPRPSVEALEQRKIALRRVRTDPADCEANITHALLSEGLDLAVLAAQVQQQVSQADQEAEAMASADDGEPRDAEAIVAAKLAEVQAAEKAAAAAADATADAEGGPAAPPPVVQSIRESAPAAGDADTGGAVVGASAAAAEPAGLDTEMGEAHGPSAELEAVPK